MPRFSNQKMMPLSVSYENCYDFGFCEKVFQTTASRNFLLSTAKVFISSKKISMEVKVKVICFTLLDLPGALFRYICLIFIYPTKKVKAGVKMIINIYKAGIVRTSVAKGAFARSSL